MKCRMMQHFIRVCTVKTKSLFRESNIIYLLEIYITYDPSIYTMEHPDFIVGSFMENSIGLKKINNDSMGECFQEYS